MQQNCLWSTKKHPQKKLTSKILHSFSQILEKKKRKIGKIQIDYRIKFVNYFAYVGVNF